jgi:hypothetical protein
MELLLVVRANLTTNKFRNICRLDLVEILSDE